MRHVCWREQESKTNSCTLDMLTKEVAHRVLWCHAGSWGIFFATASQLNSEGTIIKTLLASCRLPGAQTEKANVVKSRSPFFRSHAHLGEVIQFIQGKFHLMLQGLLQGVFLIWQAQHGIAGIS